MGERLLARIIDGIILSVVAVIVLIPGIVALATSANSSATGEPSSRAGGTFGLLIALVTLITVLYEIGFIAVRGRTIGKQVMGLTVRLEATGALPGWGPAVLRWLIPFLGGLVCGVGELLVYISPFFDNSGRRQGWHDKVAGTVVVKG
jgi:uncharacterized RDD family membrane protein YckC